MRSALERGSAVPESRPALVRRFLQSLAAAYAYGVRTAAELSGTKAAAVHLMGGGSRNSLLCRLTADATGLPVLAGPTEATAIGNLLVQARALDWIGGDLDALRVVVARDFPPVRYEPRHL